MGNQVIIAIRHDVDRLNIPSFSNHRIMGIQESDRPYKKFSNNGILLSHYHHSSDRICLAVNNELMSIMPAYLNAFEHKDENEEFKVAKRITSQYRSYRYKSIRKKTQKLQLQEPNGIKVSLFGYLTDHTSEMPENSFELMIQSIDSMSVLENNKVLRCGSWEDKIDPTPIVKIGTINSNQTAFIELYGNAFFATSAYSNSMEELTNINKIRDQIVDFDIKFLDSLGYNVNVTNEDLKYL